MKRVSLTAAILAFALLAAVVLLLSPDPALASAGHVGYGGLHLPLYGAELVLATGLDALRRQHSDLVARAAAKIGEVKDGMAAADVTRIEGEHAGLLKDAATVAAAIAAEEARGKRPTEDVAAAERERSAEIIKLATRHKMPDGFAADHIAKGTTIEAVRALILDHVAATQPRISPRLGITRDEGDTVRTAIGDAILLRAAPQAIRGDNEENRNRIDAARAWRGMSLIEMGRSFIEETQGVRLRGLSKMEIATVLLGLDMTRAGAMSTSDFPNILANVASKRLRDAYQVAPQNWKLISRQSNLPDFKERAVNQLSNLPKFKKVREGEEYQMTALSDGAEKYALATYGSIIPITRQTLVNDDLGAFNRLPTLQGRAAAETEASIFWAIFTSNPNMSDNVALFHANHGNLAGTPSPIDVANMSLARAAMRKQTGLAAKAADREPLNITPKFLIVSPDKETEAQQFLATQLYPTAASGVNPFAGTMQQITEARLTGNAWYLSADPAVIDTIEYAYLEGEEGLFIETQIGFDIDGIKVKGRLDFAAKAIEYRGLYKNAGA